MRLSDTLVRRLLLSGFFLWQLVLPVQAKFYDVNTAEGRQIAVVIDDLLRYIQAENLEALLALYHPETSALWSNGQRLENLTALKREYTKAFEEIDAFEGQWKPLKIYITGDQAWMHGEMRWQATDARNGERIVLRNQSSFILQRRYGRWLILFEHASHRQLKTE